MNPKAAKASDPARETLLGHGITPTAQRVRVAQLLFACDRHLTADQVIAALRASGSRVSKATVYNTLNLFARKGLLRALNFDPERCSFDSNTRPHYHLHDVETGELMDVPPDDVVFSRTPALPPGMENLGVDVVFRVRRQA
ncbi:MAG: transcriptional repressor [Gammaproteobacteria bacterium]|nr:transcriptional repressor [Gammaproteobacteria bacterium]